MLNQAVINLNTLEKNALAIKSGINQGVKFCAVVKADAYGHGAPVVANRIYKIVDCFAVALVEEGVELRQSGIDKDILVLTPILNADIERAVGNSLTLTVENLNQLRAIDKESKRQNKKTKIHLKYNVGMNRFGVDSLVQLNELLECVSVKSNLILDGAYSHLGCPQNKKALKIAENKFLLANNLVKRYNNKAICHLSASGGFLMGKQFDMVRIGILLYGYKPFTSRKIKVSPVMKVYAPVIRQRKICKGDSALYGDFTVDISKEVLLIRFGYADGLARSAVQGQINDRCMDVTMMEDFCAKKIFPVMENAKKLADNYGTIPYEILSKIGIRAKKIYVR